MPRHLLALALGVCAGVAVMVVAARGIALSRMLYLLAGLIFAGNLLSARLAGRFSDQALAWWIHLERKR